MRAILPLLQLLYSYTPCIFQCDVLRASGLPEHMPQHMNVCKLHYSSLIVQAEFAGFVAPRVFVSPIISAQLLSVAS